MARGGGLIALVWISAALGSEEGVPTLAAPLTVLLPVPIESVDAVVASFMADNASASRMFQTDGKVSCGVEPKVPSLGPSSRGLGFSVDGERVDTPPVPRPDPGAPELAIRCRASAWIPMLPLRHDVPAQTMTFHSWNYATQSMDTRTVTTSPARTYFVPRAHGTEEVAWFVARSAGDRATWVAFGWTRPPAELSMSLEPTAARFRALLHAAQIPEVDAVLTEAHAKWVATPRNLLAVAAFQDAWQGGRRVPGPLTSEDWHVVPPEIDMAGDAWRELQRDATKAFWDAWAASPGALGDVDRLNALLRASQGAWAADHTSDVALLSWDLARWRQLLGAGASLLTVQGIQHDRRNLCALDQEGQPYFLYLDANRPSVRDLRSITSSPRDVWLRWRDPAFAPLVDLACGRYGALACGLSADGRVGCWGGKEGGSETRRGVEPISRHRRIEARLGKAESLRFTDVFDTGSNVCGQTTKGDIVCAGAPVPALHGVSRAAGFGPIVCGIRGSGRLVCGSTAKESAARFLGARPPQGSFQDVAVGKGHACAIRTTGDVACWGEDYPGEKEPVRATAAPAGTFERVYADAGSSCALDAAGAATCWGWAYEPPEGPFVSLDLFGSTVCGVRTDGSVACNGASPRTP